MKTGKRLFMVVCLGVWLTGWASPIPAAEVGSQPRDCHYIFAHKAVPSLLFTKKEGLFKAFETRGQAFVEDLWTAVANSTAKTSKPVDSKGLEFSKEKTDGIEVYLIKLPEPLSMAEAYFVAVAEKDKKIRYFTLELTSEISRCDASTILGEWTEDGRHHNYGCGPKPEKQEFLKAISANFR